MLVEVIINTMNKLKEMLGENIYVDDISYVPFQPIIRIVLVNNTVWDYYYEEDNLVVNEELSFN